MTKELTIKTSLPMTHVPKGWGWERWIVNCEEYCGKLLFFEEGKRCSWHYHKLKDEVFYLQSGKMIVKYSEEDDIEQALNNEKYEHCSLHDRPRL